MTDQPQDISWLTGAIGTGVGMTIQYVVRNVLDRKKLRAEEDTAQLDADTKAVELYERFASQLNPKIEALETRQQELITKVTELKIENERLKLENEQLRLENSKLEHEIENLQTQFNQLKNNMHE